MAQPGGSLQQRIQQVAQHAVIGDNLLIVAPAFDQTRQFEQGGVDQMRHIAQCLGGGATSAGIGQVKREMPDRQAGRPARHSDDVRTRHAGKMLQCGVAYQAARAGHQHRLQRHQRYPPNGSVSLILPEGSIRGWGIYDAFRP